MKKETTQCDRILSYLETHTAINPMQAWEECGVYRLGARIYDLKHKKGVKITKRMIDVPNRFGEKCKVAQYRLEV